MDWYSIKLFLQHATGWSMDSLHVIAGVLLQLLAAWLLRTSVGHAIPLAIVLAAACVNEANDLWVEQWPQAAMQYGESLKDLVLTLILPVALFCVAKVRPSLLQGGRRTDPMRAVQNGLDCPPLRSTPDP